MRAIAQFCYRRRRLVVLAWVAFFIGVTGISAAFAGEFKTEFELPGSESQAAFDLLKERGIEERTGEQGRVVFETAQGVDDPAVKAAMVALFTGIVTATEVEIVSPYEQGNEYQVSEDGTIAYAELNFSDRSYEEYTDDADLIKELRAEVDVEGLRIELGGDMFADSPAFSSEFVGLAAAIIILLIAFGSLLAMGLPIVTALFGIGCGIALVGLVTRILAVPDFTTQMAGMIGIGVGIDYALLIVTRYRDTLHRVDDPEEAVLVSLDTSGRAVIFAGLTVVISLLGMFMLNLDFVRAVSIGALLAVLMTMAAAITLLPALLGFVGRNIDRLGLPHARQKPGDIHHSWWWRWSRVIQAHPWPAAILSTSFLILLTIPVFSMRLGFGDAGNRPDTDTSRRAYDTLSEGFGPGFNGPVLIVADTNGEANPESALGDLATGLAATPGVDSIDGPDFFEDANLGLITVFPDSAPQDAETEDLVHRLRKQTIREFESDTGVQVLATGGPAVVVDFADYTGERMVYFIAAVLALSFVLLLTVFHSVIVPLKAVIMNMLSIGAAFGAMVAVFQWGWGAELIGLGKEGPIEAWAPMMLFAIIFGLSMDYEVFLLTRIREEYDRTGDNARAVADGLAATGRVITAAALIMVCVFGSFILGELRDLKLMGFGLAFAILVDATVVRMVLVPSAMELLGDKNWWAPSWLVRALPRIHVDPAVQDNPVIS